MKWQSAQDTHRGNRRTENEDAVFSSVEKGIWMVADGMGGHSAGDYASEYIADSLAQLELDENLGESVDRVEDCLLFVNDHLRHYAREHCPGGTIGSTVVVMLARENTGVVLWAGDSRLYRVRGRTLELITRDHNPVADLLDTGGVTEEQALNCDTHVVTRAVGGQNELHLDIAVFDIQPGDTMLLCTDGLYRELKAPEIAHALEMGVDDAVAEMMRSCLAGDARDNVSLVVTRAQTAMQGGL